MITCGPGLGLVAQYVNKCVQLHQEVGPSVGDGQIVVHHGSVTHRSETLVVWGVRPLQMGVQ